MRSQFTWKWPPTLIEVVCFTYFAAGMRCNAPTVSRGLQSGAPISSTQELPPNFKLTKFQTSKNWELRLHDRRQDKAQVTLEIFVDSGHESKLMGQPEPDSPDIQSPPHESDFIRCQRAFHLPLSHLSHNCVFPCHLWIMDGRRKQTYSANSSLL